ncbi:TlpA family protein disulfide reductase [Homoserinibacter sp. YIM 151385]|uniref:TlpA family protein disulfide reductase n=1 Tax=Homoserinibacter sp. YIM 151385 TaxID=2985506 RepID=UPI0022F0F174|nr:TlpA disulfide reductase family protein [Homoserinibacter sp. YIM 151385]WBU37013.1 TlpA disulfide reductase family protein [Homoserinibacter sp. YIM 151385]
MKRLVSAVGALAAALLLAACTSGGSGDLVESYTKGDAGGGYISGDGSVVTVAVGDRKPVQAYAGELDTGAGFDSAELEGRVSLLNFWYANCPPCRTEAPDLAELHEQYEADEDVVFLGVNVEDSAPRALGFAREYGIRYPSILDQGDNAVQLAFAGTVAPNAVPTTLVLDREGRVAARFSGIITDPALVSTIIDDTLAEGD